VDRVECQIDQGAMKDLRVCLGVVMTIDVEMREIKLAPVGGELVVKCLE